MIWHVFACLPLLQEPDSKDNKLFLDVLYHDYFYKDIERRVHKHGVQVRSAPVAANYSARQNVLIAPARAELLSQLVASVRGIFGRDAHVFL
jgi:hypothetical protein